jgi:tetratricopeptide (TPR) repeat protein
MENIFFELGNEAFDEENFEEAIKQFNKALDIEPDNDEILYNLSLSLYCTDEYQTSIAVSNKIMFLDNDPDIFELALFNRGNCYHKLNEYEKAINDFSAIIDLYPDDPNAYYNRANAREKLGDAKGAQEDRHVAKHLDQKESTQNLYRTPEPSEIGDYSLDIFIQDKERLLNEISVTPNSYSLHFELGNAYAKIREFHKAIEHFNKAIELYPEDFYENANQNLIAAYSDIADYHKVIELANEFLKHNPVVDIVKKMRSWATEELEETS